MTTDDIKRLNFYEKQFLGTRDFQDEQAYHIEMRRRHFIAHHIWGIVAGFEIIQDQNSKIWSVQPGMAIDGFGREIVVFSAEQLNIAEIANRLSSIRKPANLKVWIVYHIEKTRRPAPGYEVCGGNSQFMRTHETFRLIYDNNPVFRVQGSSTNIQNPDDQQSWPKAFHDLPEDPGQARWPVYLGTLTWDTDPNDARKNIITGVDFVDPNDNKKRRHIGAVAELLEVPNIKKDGTFLNNELLIRGRANSTPLIGNPGYPNDSGVSVKLEGSLEIDRRLNVINSAGIGIGDLSNEPATKLQISGGTNATLQGGTTGYLVIGEVTGPNIVMDNHAIMARNNGQKSGLHLQANGGDLVVHRDQAGSEFVVKDTGNVGIGTMSPDRSLTIANSAGSNYMNVKDGTREILMGVDGNGGIVSVMSNHDLILRTGTNNEKMRITAGGNVGIGTTTPVSKLEIAGDVVLQLMTTGARRSLPPGGTMIWNDGRWLRLNQNLDFSIPIFGVHTPGVFAPGSLNVGGAGGWGDPGPGNVWVTGNVGIGTTTPGNKLHVAAPAHINAIFDRTDTQDHLTLTVGSNGSGIHFGNSNRFFISADPYADRNIQSFGNEVFTILPNGNMGIGTPNPQYKLDVPSGWFRFGPGGDSGRIFADYGPQNAPILKLSDYDDAPRIQFQQIGTGNESNPQYSAWIGMARGSSSDLSIMNGNVGIGTSSPGIYKLFVNGSAAKPGGGLWTASSDERLKKNIQTLQDALKKLTTLRGVSFEWKEPEKQGNLTGNQMGLIAQEVEKVFPEWVGTDTDGYKDLTIRGFEALTIEAFKEIKEENDKMKTRIEKIESRLFTKK